MRRCGTPAPSSKNRDRLLAGDVAQRLLAAVVDQARVKALMSHEHFSVDGTLIQAWASHKSFQPKVGPGDDGPPAPGRSSGTAGGRNGERDWRGQKRSNETHRSTTDGDARLARKSNGQASIPAYAGHVLMENANGGVARSCLSHATGTAERDAGLQLVERLEARRRITLGADKGYDAAGFIAALRERNVTPHVAADRRISKTGIAEAFCRGWSHDTSLRISSQPACSQTDRGSVRLDQGRRRAAPDQASRPTARRLGVRLGNHRLQPHSTAKAATTSSRLSPRRLPDTAQPLLPSAWLTAQRLASHFFSSLLGQITLAFFISLTSSGVQPSHSP